ncbi:MAG: NAD(P)-dependent oxidoreductase [Pseudomonadota bacterium]|nr:NAD(P)-dependent oxidoreductase [Pseudomonadota bacterium]
MNVGLIGIGRMGGAMARRLLAHGCDLGVFDQAPQQTDPLREAGAYIATSVADLCRGRSLIITMLPTDRILEDVAVGPFGLTESLETDAVHMVSGTHGVSVIERLIAAHKQHGRALVCCTVLGRPDRAAEGKLGLIPAGPAVAVEGIMPVLKVLGDTIFCAGENPLSAVAIKIANNFVLGCAIEAMGEAMALARKYEVDPLLFYQVLTQGLFNCVAYQSYGDVIARQDWGRVGATATIGLKDAQLAFEAAEKVHVPLPSGNVWRDHLLTACGRGEASLDWAIMAREQFRNSGLE